MTCTDIDECESSPCRNNETCHGNANVYTCLCSSNCFTGVLCETRLDKCFETPTSPEDKSNESSDDGVSPAILAASIDSSLSLEPQGYNILNY